MQLEVTNPQFQTLIFSLILALGLLASIKKVKRETFFPNWLTQELKGFAMLAIIFSHLGHFLAKDHSFLFPLSVMAGGGVNIFLFLSGFGLTISALKTHLPVKDFYLKRLPRLFLPLWIVITVFFIMDFILLNKTYSLTTIFQSYLGFFPVAEPFQSLDSPLWYFSLIFFYYLIFPWVFKDKLKFLSPLIILFISYLLLALNLPIRWDVIQVYKTHTLAFPLGIAFALIIPKLTNLAKLLPSKTHLLSWPATALLLILLSHYAIYSGVGDGLGIEQWLSIVMVAIVTAIFLLKNFRIRLLGLVGIFSYEIYLIHWPLLARYDLFYRYLPASVATALYLALFLGLSYLIQKLVDALSRLSLSK